MAEKKYIERKTIYQIAKKVVDAITSGNYHPGVFAYDILDWIDDLPAADVREVVRAKWIDNGPDGVCSKCGFTCDDFYYLGEANFCPNCGADMRPKPPKEE